MAYYVNMKKQKTRKETRRIIMQNISKLSIQKVLATVLIALLVLANAMPSLSYAADVAQDVKTSEENVEFSAVFEKVQDSKTTQESTENVANEKQSEEAKTESASINSFAKNLTATRFQMEQIANYILQQQALKKKAQIVRGAKRQQTKLKKALQ